VTGVQTCALPISALGLGLLLATVVLASMSIPLGFRAYAGLDLTDTERARLERVLGTLDFGEPTDTHALADPSALAEGRDLVTRRCTQCHDLRSILSEPRTGPTWLALVRRMADKPGIIQPMDDHEVMHVTSYLVAITPDLQRDAASRYAASRALTLEEAPPSVAVDAGVDAGDGTDASLTAEGSASVDASVALDASAPIRRVRRRGRSDGGVGPSPELVVTDRPAETMVQTPTVAPVPTPSLAPSLSGAQLLAVRCQDCHGDEELDTHGPDDLPGWSAVLRRMVGRGADLSRPELTTLAAYLAATRGM
jgi:mono/diheme cytochrome c family protein